jgi:ubiquinone/menaquinone biosynthesis C-methylase UbiE
MTKPTPNLKPATNQAASASTDRDARFWDGIAQKYAADPIEDVAGYERTLARVAEFLGPDDHVLEMGCGTGSTALRLAPHVAHITATDLSGAMIDIARQKARDEGVDSVSFEVAPAEDNRSDGRAFDATLAFNLLHLVRDLDSALEQIHASLKPGGVFISKTPCLKQMNPLIRWVMIPLMQAVGKAPGVLSLSFGELESAIKRAGFTIEHVEFHGTKGKDTRPFIVARRA